MGHIGDRSADRPALMAVPVTDLCPPPATSVPVYWTPFFGGQAPVPGYCMSLTEDERAALRERIRQTLPIRPDGSIALIARAWTVRGLRPGETDRSEEHTSELQSHSFISYAVFCLKKKKN